MTDKAVVIGESREAVVVTAQARGVAIDNAVIVPFSLLKVYWSDHFPESGSVDTSCGGWVVIGDVPE